MISENYILGLSGTHGTGKSTVLNSLSRFISVDRSQLSRTAQTNLGWDSLSKAQESESNMWDLQHSILCAMINRDLEISKSKKLTIAERTPADLYAYTRLWLYRLDIDWRSNKTFKTYNKALIAAMQSLKYNFVIYPHKNIPFVAEPARADLDSRDFVKDHIDLFLLSNTHLDDFKNRYVPIRMPDNEERVETILAKLGVKK